MNPIWLILSVMNPEFRIEFDEPTVACIESNAFISGLIILMLSASSNASKIICINSDLILSTFISKYDNRSQIALYTFPSIFGDFSTIVPTIYYGTVLRFRLLRLYTEVGKYLLEIYLSFANLINIFKQLFILVIRYINRLRYKRLIFNTSCAFDATIHAVTSIFHRTYVCNKYFAIFTRIFELLPQFPIIITYKL